MDNPNNISTMQVVDRSDFNIIFIGEEGVGKSSLINTILDENRAPISDMHTQTWKMTKYSLKINDLLLNLFDIPGIEGRFSDEQIVEEIKNRYYDLIICCLDGTRIRPSSMVKKSINFIKKYIPNVPILFAITKDNLVQKKSRIGDIKSYVRENANSQFRHFGLVSIGNKVEFSKNSEFWKEIVTCVPEFEDFLFNNFKKYNDDKEKMEDEVLDHITNNYEMIPEINKKLKSKREFMNNFGLVLDIWLYLFVAYCVVIILCDVAYLYYFKVLTFVLTIILILQKIFYFYCSSNHFRLFPVNVENVVTENWTFDGIIYYVPASGNKNYTKLRGMATTNDTKYNIENYNKNYGIFECCDTSIKYINV